MKRVLSLIFATIILFVFCACGREKLPEEIKALFPQTDSSSFIESAEPPSPEAVTAEISNFIPSELPFDPADYPLLKTPPTLAELLGDYPETFVFNEKEWTFVEEDEYAKRYVNDENLYLSLSESGSVSLTDENIADVCIFYDENKKIEYFMTPDASFDPYVCYPSQGSSYNGANIMIRKENVRYHYDRHENGTLLSVRVEVENNKDDWNITRSYTFDPATDSLTHASIDIERENSPHAFTAEYDAEGKLWAQPMYIYCYPDEESHKDFIYLFYEDFTFWEKTLRVQE